jgi:hypothetical protein
MMTDTNATETNSIVVQPTSPLNDPLLDIRDLITAKIVGSRDGANAAINKGWLPPPIRWPNGRMFWRKSVIENAVLEIERGFDEVGEAT